jgi:sterol 3beta-glucosyltransferase
LQAGLTAENLAEAIRAATSDETMRARAAAIGRQIQAEDGVGMAVEIVNRYLAQRPRFFDGLRL